MEFVRYRNNWTSGTSNKEIKVPLPERTKRWFDWNAPRPLANVPPPLPFKPTCDAISSCIRLIPLINGLVVLECLVCEAQFERFPTTSSAQLYLPLTFSIRPLFAPFFAGKCRNTEKLCVKWSALLKALQQSAPTGKAILLILNLGITSLILIVWLHSLQPGNSCEWNAVSFGTAGNGFHRQFGRGVNSN